MALDDCRVLGLAQDLQQVVVAQEVEARELAALLLQEVGERALAQGESVIRKALTELKMWGMTREFTFTENTQNVGGAGWGGVGGCGSRLARGRGRSRAARAAAVCARRLRGSCMHACPCPLRAPPLSPVSQVGGRQRRTPLIKEWRDAMTEVGDNMSLVASLKQSGFYNQFKDEVRSRPWGRADGRLLLRT